MPLDIARLAAVEPPPAAPELSLASVFGADQKFAHVGRVELPRWIYADAKHTQPILIQRQRDGWKQVSIETGRRTNWPIVEQLRGLLQPFRKPNSDNPNSDPASEEWQDDWIDGPITKIESLGEPFLTQIDQTLLWVDLEPLNSQRADDAVVKVISRDVAAWRDTTLDPTGRRIGYTIAGDMYVYDISMHATRRLTDDGSTLQLDGRLDWIYQEEIFGRGNFRGFWFSPDGERVAVMRLDETQVPVYRVGDSDAAAGAGEPTPYPKAGDPIPAVALTVFELSHGTPTEIFSSAFQPPDADAAHASDILAGVWWNPYDGRLLYCTLDRRQQHRCLWSWNPATDTSATLLYRENSATWIEPPHAPEPVSAGGLYWYSQTDTGRGRVYWIADDGNNSLAVTPESFHVREMMLTHGRRLHVTGAELPWEQHVYEIRPASNRELPSGLTGGLTGGGANETQHFVRLTEGRGWHEPRFALASHLAAATPTLWYVRSHSVDDPGSITLRSTVATKVSVRPSGTPTSTILDNIPLRLAQPLTPTAVVQIPVGDDRQVHGLLTMATAGGEPVAAVVEVYGGPQTSVATDRWHGEQRLVREIRARQGIATLVVDNRSSMSSGVGNSWPIAGHFGRVEVADTIAAAQWLGNLPAIDADRIAITGWSFGGYLVANTMTQTDVFAGGVAGGSVTDWRQYDAFYTERYMGLPSENADGYADSSVLTRAANLSGRLLLIHGAVDDNVHLAGTLDLAGALQKAGKSFEMMIYPGAKHAVEDAAQKLHLNQLREDFLRRVLRSDAAQRH